MNLTHTKSILETFYSLYRYSIGCNVWIRSKIKKDRSFDGYKIHIVVKTISHEYDIDYDKIFYQITEITSIQVLIYVDAFYDWMLYQMDF